MSTTSTNSSSTTSQQKIEGFDEYQCTNGWFDPDGRYYPMPDFACHGIWAWKFLLKNMDHSKLSSLLIEAGSNATRLLEKLGWIRVMTWPDVGNTEFSFEERKLTSCQKDSLYLFCAIHHIPVPLQKEYW